MLVNDGVLRQICIDQGELRATGAEAMLTARKLIYRNGIMPLRASSSARSLPSMPLWPSTHRQLTR